MIRNYDQPGSFDKRTPNDGAIKHKLDSWHFGKLRRAPIAVAISAIVLGACDSRGQTHPSSLKNNGGHAITNLATTPNTTHASQATILPTSEIESRQLLVEQYDDAVENHVRQPIFDAVSDIMNNPGAYPDINIEVIPDDDGLNNSILIERELGDGSILHVTLTGITGDKKDRVALNNSSFLLLEFKGARGGAQTNSENPDGRALLGRVVCEIQNIKNSGKYMVSASSGSHQNYSNKPLVGDQSKGGQINMSNALQVADAASQITATGLNALTS